MTRTPNPLSNESYRRIRPRYEGTSIAALPEIAAAALGVSSGGPPPDGMPDSLPGDIDCVVVLVVDGFGLDCWQRDKHEHRFLTRLEQSGTVSSLTSTFPSATAAAMTSVHTGVPPGEHGIVGWSQYHPSIDRVVEPIPYRFRGGEPGEATAVVSPEAVVTAPSVYPELERQGCSTHVLQQTITLESAYARRTLEGASTHPFEDIDDMARRLRETIEATDRPAYICVHLLDLDTVAHAHGTDSPEYQSVLSTLSAALEEQLLDTGATNGTLLLLTADHGHVDTEPAATVTPVEDPVVFDRLATRADGTPIRPTGGPRNTHLHLRPGSVSTVAEYLRTEYDLDVVSRDRLESAHLLGPTVTEPVRRRCGDLLVGHPDHSVWSTTDGAADRVGQHGWLTRRELLVPLVAADLAAVES